MLRRLMRGKTTYCDFLCKVGENSCFSLDFKDCNIKNSPI